MEKDPLSRRKIIKSTMVGALATAVATLTLSKLPDQTANALGPTQTGSGTNFILGVQNNANSGDATQLFGYPAGGGGQVFEVLTGIGAGDSESAALSAWASGAGVAIDAWSSGSNYALQARASGQYAVARFRNTVTSGDKTALVDWETGDTTPNYWRLVASGAGNGLAVPAGSFYFEHPPGTPTVTISPIGNLGVGTINPQSHLYVVDSTTNPSRGVVASQNNSGAQAALMQMTKSRGTQTAPSAVANGDYVGAFNMNAHDGTNYLGGKPMAGWGAKVNGTVAAGSIPTDLFFYTKPSGTLDPYGDHVVRFIIASNGNIYANGSLLSASDVRLKTDIEPIPNALDKVLALNGVYFHWNKDANQPDGRQVGVIAQNVQQVLPEVVSTSPSSKDYLSVDYTRLVPVLIQAMKEQQEQFKNENEKLHERIAILERTVKQFAAS